MTTAPDENDTALLKMIMNRNIDIYVKRDRILDENLQKSVLSDPWSMQRTSLEQAQDECKPGDSVFPVRYAGIS